MDNFRMKDVVELTILNKNLGQNKNFTWKVGNTYRPKKVEVQCTKIIHDTNAYHFHGQSRWVVFLAPVVDGKVDMDQESEFAVYENAQVEAKRDIQKIFLT